MTPQEIFEKVKCEIARGRSKHGKWTALYKSQQIKAINSELKEMKDARDAGDIHGEHGEIAEATQVIAVLFRRIMYLTGEDQ